MHLWNRMVRIISLFKASVSKWSFDKRWKINYYMNCWKNWEPY